MLVAAKIQNEVKILGQNHWVNLYGADKRGKHTRELDRALPGTHTKLLSDRLTRPKAAILAQMRTGKCKLKSYLHSIGAEDSDVCECGQKETVKHVLLDCRRWKRRKTRADGSSQGQKPMGRYVFLVGRMV